MKRNKSPYDGIKCIGCGHAVSKHGKNGCYYTARCECSRHWTREEIRTTLEPSARPVVGISGTRNEPTNDQMKWIMKEMLSLVPREFRHGDCVGVDSYAHGVALQLGIPVTIHPPADPKLRAYRHGAAKVFPPRPYFQRNRDIANSCDILLVVPDRTSRGTWTTMRYAEEAGKEIRLCKSELLTVPE